MTKIHYVDELPELPLDGARVCMRREDGGWICGQWRGRHAIADAENCLQGFLLEGAAYGFTNECLIEGAGFNQSWAIEMRKKVSTAIRALAQVISTACM